MPWDREERPLDERKRQVLSALIRFGSIVPWAFYGFSGMGHYTFMRSRADVLFVPPLSRTLLTAIRLNGIGV